MAVKCKPGSFKRVGPLGEQKCLCTSPKYGRVIVSMDRCRASRSAKLGARRASMRTRAKKACVPGTTKMRQMGASGRRCSCETRGGGRKIVKTSRCK